MLNKIWPFFIVISIVFAVVFGNVESVNSSIFKSTEDAISVTITLIGTMCLWNGIMKIASSTTLISKLTNMLKPLISFLFPEVKENTEIREKISMNMVANVLGLGNAATPLGLSAMEKLQKINNDKSKLSNSMMMFILINTASIQILPTTVFAIRESLGSKNPTSILIQTWGATICAAVVGVTFAKILIKRIK